MLLIMMITTIMVMVIMVHCDRTNLNQPKHSVDGDDDADDDDDGDDEAEDDDDDIGEDDDGHSNCLALRPTQAFSQ